MIKFIRVSFLALCLYVLTLFSKPQSKMWEHRCPVEGLMEVGKDEPCSWCGAEDLTHDTW